MLKNSWLRRFAVSLLAVGFGASVAFAMAGTTLGTVQLHTGEIAPRGEVTFVAFINGKDDVIHTENAYNSALGLGQGHIVQNNTSLWLVNFANFTQAKPGDAFTAVFTSKDGSLRGTYAGEVPPGFTQLNDKVVLKPMAMPRPVGNMQAQRTDGGVMLTWNAESNTKYRVYRADLPSGADNGASRGIYDKVAEGVTGGSWVDTNTSKDQSYWYLILAEDKNGTLSGHSGEIRVTPIGTATDLKRVDQDLLQSGKDFQKGSKNKSDR